MRSGFIGFRPSLSFSSFPLHTHFLSLCLHVLAPHPFLFCAHIGPALSVYLVCTRTHMLNPGLRLVSGRPGCYKEVGFIGCVWSLGSTSLQPHKSGLSCPPFMSSFVCLFCALTCELVVTLVFSPPHSGGVCVCVCVCVCV